MKCEHCGTEIIAAELAGLDAGRIHAVGCCRDVLKAQLQKLHEAVNGSNDWSRIVARAAMYDALKAQLKTAREALERTASHHTQCWCPACTYVAALDKTEADK